MPSRSGHRRSSRTSRRRKASAEPRHEISAPVRFLRMLVGILVLLLVLWAVTAGLTGDGFALGRLGIYVAPSLMVLAGGFVLLALVLRAWVSMAGAVLVALGLFALFAPQLLRPEAELPPGAGTLTVLSQSVRGGSVEAFLRENPADIIALQEVDGAEDLVLRLRGLYGEAPLHHCLQDREVILSRFQVGAPDPVSRTLQLFCEVALPEGPVLVASLHMPKARFGGAEQQLQAFEALAAVIDVEQRPLILMGDFNTTPLTRPFGLLSARLTHAFSQAGRGFGATFPTPARPALGAVGAFLAIDHVFVSAAFEVLAAEVLGRYADKADHYPVRAVLRHWAR